MHFDSFISALEGSGFSTRGVSFAYQQCGDWGIAFISLGGRFQVIGRKSFVICARPTNFPGVDGKIPAEPSNEPHDYPFKLTGKDLKGELQYTSRLLRYDHEELAPDADWSQVHATLVNWLPGKLQQLGVEGLLEQLRNLKEPGYVEKVWMGVKTDV